MVTGNSYDTTNALTDTPTRNLQNATNSPLQIFVRAKKKINDIFLEIEEYVIDTTRFIDSSKFKNINKKKLKITKKSIFQHFHKRLKLLINVKLNNFVVLFKRLLEFVQF